MNGERSQARALLQSGAVSTILVASESHDEALVEECLRWSDGRSVEFAIVLPVGTASSRVARIGDLGVVPLGRNEVASQRPWLKRAVDILASAALLLLLAPVLVIVSAAIYLYDRGPVIYRQRRVGLDNREFRIWKFRSMVPGADKLNLRRLRRLRPRPARRPPDLRRLYALQHRGQESAGMAVSDGDTITVVKDMGLVTNVFDERTPGAAAGPPRHRPHPLLHHRLEHLAQRPARLPGGRRGGAFALGHNGNLTNTDALAEEAGMLPGHGHQRQRPGRRAARPASLANAEDAATAATSSGPW